MNYSRFKSLIAVLMSVATAIGALAAEKPNIIWIIVEDMWYVPGTVVMKP